MTPLVAGSSPLVVLDGPMGTELAARGVAVSTPAWSAAALVDAADAVTAIHRDYAGAGATVHTANTFRTRARQVGEAWRHLASRAVQLARAAVPAGHRVAGSLAPLEDCYRPDLSPDDPRPEHRALARHLARAGVDLLLVETFPHVGEALVAVEEAVDTGLETWVAFTAGPGADLLTASEMARGAREAIDRGARAVLVNCTPARDTLRFVQAIASDRVPFGAYANAGERSHGLGWGHPGAPAAYAEVAATWVDAGATLVGACCGCGPDHVGAIARRFGAEGVTDPA